jgi:hypothetical protein
MLNQIIEAISTAIFAEFGEGYKCYMESIEQGLEEPCFFVQCLNPSHELFLNRRYFRQNHFVIQYFPKDHDYHRECHDVAERLYGCLEYITLYDADAEADESKPIRGGEMHFEIANGVLNFMVDYNCFMNKAESNDAMETMESVTIPTE